MCDVCGPVTTQASPCYDTIPGSYKREDEALAAGNSHIKTVLQWDMGRAVSLHPAALDYSCNCVCLHVYVITVILYHLGIPTPLADLDFATVHYFTHGPAFEVELGNWC